MESIVFKTNFLVNSILGGTNWSSNSNVKKIIEICIWIIRFEQGILNCKVLRTVVFNYRTHVSFTASIITLNNLNILKYNFSFKIIACILKVAIYLKFKPKRTSVLIHYNIRKGSYKRVKASHKPSLGIHPNVVHLNRSILKLNKLDECWVSVDNREIRI